MSEEVMDDKPLTVKEFKKQHPELKSKKIVLCEHLKNKSIEHVNINLFIGDNTRLLLCPVCTKVHSQTVWNHMIKSALFMMDTAKKIEYSQWLQEAGKE